MLATGTVPSEASVAASTMKPEPVTPGGTLGGQQQDADQAQLLAEA